MFDVRWREEAEQRLAALWSEADTATRTRITAATAQVDHDLARDPVGKSESRAGGRRILFEPPLGVSFQIESDGHTVSVLHIWRFGKRQK